MRTLVDPLSELRMLTHCHRPDGRNNKRVFLTVLGAGKSRVKVPADSMSGESPSSWFAHSHLLATSPRGGEKGLLCLVL